MQSELSCHIGSMGKFFCRICRVKGSDNLVSPPLTESGPVPVPPPLSTSGPALANNEDIGAGGGESDMDGSESEAQSPKKRRGKKVETMQEMVDRVKRFVNVSKIATQIVNCPISIAGR
jgi:hypothetical protein